MKPFFVQTWIHEVTYQSSMQKPLPRNQPLLPKAHGQLPTGQIPHGSIPNAYGQHNPHFARQLGTYAQGYNANLPPGSLKTQVYFLQQELTRISGHIDQIMHQVRITPSHNREVLVALLRPTLNSFKHFEKYVDDEYFTGNETQSWYGHCWR